MFYEYNGILHSQKSAEKFAMVNKEAGSRNA